MNLKKEQQPHHSVNLFPITAIALLSLLGIVAGLVMLYGLHVKIPKPREVAKTMPFVTADEIGEIKLDQNMVRINLMSRDGAGKLGKLQEIEIPLEKFLAGYPRIQSLMDRMIEEGIITEQ